MLNKILYIEILGDVAASPTIIALAVLVVTFVFVGRCQRSGLSRYHSLGVSLWGIIGGMIGARVFYLLQDWKTTISYPSQIFDVSGGTASWGAYLGGGIGLIFYLKFYREKVLPYADVLSSCLGLGPFIGRWSCFLNGCCFGRPSELPWAVSYPRGSVPHLLQIDSGLLGDGAEFSLPIHPTQIYHSLIGLVLFGLMTWYWKKWKHKPGVTFFSYWILYCCMRFVLDYFRGDEARGFVGPLPVPQIMAISIVLLSSVGLFYCLRNDHKEK